VSELNVHDADVVGITIACEARRIILHTQWKHLDRIEYSDVVFDGVVGHHFESVLEGNILFDIDEVGLKDFLIREWTHFEAQRAFGWPDVRAVWDSQEQLFDLLEARGIHAFEIAASYGLSGFVLAQSVKQHYRSSPWRVPE
jgi:hypothetical protein